MIQQKQLQEAGLRLGEAEAAQEQAQRGATVTVTAAHETHRQVVKAASYFIGSETDVTLCQAKENYHKQAAKVLVHDEFDNEKIKEVQVPSHS